MKVKINEFLEKNYKSSDGARTSQWSQGNGDDQFYDGLAVGYAQALSDIAALCEIKVEPLAEPNID